MSDANYCSPCQHDWCYAPHILPTYPAQYPKICRKCGEQGVDRGEYVDLDEYDRIRQRFEVTS